MPTLRATVVWLLLLALVLGLPFLTASTTVGDDLIRDTIRLSLLYYAIALNLMLGLRPADWPALTPRGRRARACWTLAWLAYALHVGMAFHWVHGWSHTAAVEHVRSVSGVGAGIYVSHGFTLAWGADVLYWWLRPKGYACRPPWVGRALHGFMLFVVFNGTVVYETGFIRWAGVVLFVELAAIVWWHR